MAVFGLLAYRKEDSVWRYCQECISIKMCHTSFNALGWGFTRKTSSFLQASLQCGCQIVEPVKAESFVIDDLDRMLCCLYNKEQISSNWPKRNISSPSVKTSPHRLHLAQLGWKFLSPAFSESGQKEGLGQFYYLVFDFTWNILAIK